MAYRSFTRGTHRDGATVRSRDRLELLALACATVLTENRRALQDLDIVMVANHAVPAAPHLLPGVSGWIREEKGAMPC